MLAVPRAHAGAATLGGGAFIAGVVLAVLAATSDRLPGDLAATRTVQDWPFPGQTFADALRFVSATEFVVALGAALAVGIWLSGRRRPALALAAGLALMVLLQYGVKELVDRPRPPPDLVELRSGFTSPSFPSGHTMSPTYLYGFLAAAALAAPFRAVARVGAAAAVAVFLALSGLANVWLGVHWFTDVIGGYLWALAVLVPATRAALPARPSGALA